MRLLLPSLAKCINFSSLECDTRSGGPYRSRRRTIAQMCSSLPSRNLWLAGEPTAKLHQARMGLLGNLGGDTPAPPDHQSPRPSFISLMGQVRQPERTRVRSTNLKTMLHLHLRCHGQTLVIYCMGKITENSTDNAPTIVSFHPAASVGSNSMFCSLMPPSALYEF